MKSERVLKPIARSVFKFGLRAIAPASLMLLSACAASQAFHQGNALLAEGKYEPALEKLEEAVHRDPKNAEYRIALAIGRASALNRLTLEADTARRRGRLSDAEKFYRQILELDAFNVMARQGMDAIVMERRHRNIVTEAEALFQRGTDSDLADALEKLRPVLSENPGQKEALNLNARIEDAMVKERGQDVQLAVAFRKPISLEFRDAPLKSVLDVVSKVSGLNFFYDKDVRSDLKVTVFAKNTSIEGAMRLLLVTNQLEEKVLSDNTILIYPSTPQKLKDYQTLSVRTFYLANADVKSVANSIKTIVKTTDLVADERLGLIIMRDTPEAIRIAERIVALQDLSDPEVMLEVEVMEVKRTRLQELGIQWPDQLTLSPLQAGDTPLTLNALRHLNQSTTQATVGSLVVNAHRDDSDGNILANPRIRVRNKEKAKILIGDRVPVITTTSTSTGFVSESVNYVDVGLKLEVEPNIYLDQEVAMKVNLEVSSIVKEVLSKSGTLAYQIGTRNADTVLRLKDGETAILAGLISDEDRTSANKIPGLGSLPLVGRLFGSQKDDNQRSEILLSITPHVVRSIRRPDLLSAEFNSGTSTSIGADSLRLMTVSPAEQTPDKGAEQVLGATDPAPGGQTAMQINDAPVPVSEPEPIMKSTSSLPASTASGSPLAVAYGGLSLKWQMPDEIKAGEQFSAVLNISSQGALRGLPLLIGFDPQLLQVVSVTEGDFLKQGGAATSFSQRIDPAQGKVFVALVRQSTSTNDAGINGTGSVVTINFKALRPPARMASASANIALLSLSPSPEPIERVPLPVEQKINVVP